MWFSSVSSVFYSFLVIHVSRTLFSSSIALGMDLLPVYSRYLRPACYSVFVCCFRRLAASEDVRPALDAGGLSDHQLPDRPQARLAAAGRHFGTGEPPPPSPRTPQNTSANHPTSKHTDTATGPTLPSHRGPPGSSRPARPGKTRPGPGSSVARCAEWPPDGSFGTNEWKCGVRPECTGGSTEIVLPGFCV